MPLTEVVGSLIWTTLYPSCNFWRVKKTPLEKSFFPRMPSAKICHPFPSTLTQFKSSRKILLEHKDEPIIVNLQSDLHQLLLQKTLQRTVNAVTYVQWFCWSFHATPTCPDASKLAWNASFTVGLWKKKSNETEILCWLKEQENCFQTQKIQGCCLWKQPRSRKKWWNSDFNLFLLPDWGFPERMKHNAYD